MRKYTFLVLGSLPPFLPAVLCKRPAVDIFFNNAKKLKTAFISSFQSLVYYTFRAYCNKSVLIYAIRCIYRVLEFCSVYFAAHLLFISLPLIYSFSKIYSYLLSSLQRLSISLTDSALIEASSLPTATIAYLLLSEISYIYTSAKTCSLSLSRDSA